MGAASSRHSLRPRDFRGSVDGQSPGVIAPRKTRLRARRMPSIIRIAVADDYRPCPPAAERFWLILSCYISPILL